jgi:hypothetical protein
MTPQVFERTLLLGGVQQSARPTSLKTNALRTENGLYEPSERVHSGTCIPHNCCKQAITLIEAGRPPGGPFFRSMSVIAMFQHQLSRSGDFFTAKVPFIRQRRRVG